MLKHSVDPSPNTVSESIQLQQIAYEFRQELQQRDDFEAYCEWYYAAAAQNRAELAAMKHDIPFFSWFCRSKA